MAVTDGAAGTYWAVQAVVRGPELVVCPGECGVQDRVVHVQCGSPSWLVCLIITDEAELVT